MGGAGHTYDPSTSKSGDTSDKIFQSSTDEVEQAVSPQRNVFISFDIDDQGPVNLLRIQARDDRFPFEFRDYSVKEPFEEKWKTRVRERIEQTSALLVMIGPDTVNSKAVDWEIREAHRQNKKVIGVRIHRDQNHPIPSALKEHGDEITNWDTKKLANLLSR